MLFDDKIKSESGDLKKWETLENLCGLTQRVAGTTTYAWKFATRKYAGEGTKRTPFELFDEVLCKMLLIEEGLSSEQMRTLLGLGGDLGEKAFHRMKAPLQGSMISGDESYLALTDKGRIYAKEGSKYETIKKDFELIQDLQSLQDLQANQTLKSLGKSTLISDQEVASLDPKDILEFTEMQFSSIHLPEKGFYLDKVHEGQTRVLGIEVIIGIIEDFEHEIEIFYVLDSKTGKLNQKLSNRLSHPEMENLRIELLQKFVSEHETEQSENEKDEGQLVSEAVLIQLKAELSDSKGPKQRESEKKLRQDAQNFRKNFTTLEFERELERVAETCKNECWFISPWIRKNAFSERKNQIEKMLKRGASVMIAFSEPHRRGDEMLETGILNQLIAWEEQYEGFFFVEMPSFHEKIMIADLSDNEKYEYTGSFNILSFSAIGKVKIGRENMRRLAWGEDSEKNYQFYHSHFLDKQKAKFSKLIKEWQQIPSAKAPDEIKNREKRLAFFKAKFSRLGLAITDLPDGKEANAMQEKSRLDWVRKSLINLSQKYEKQVKNDPGNLGNVESEIRKILNTFPGVDKDEIKELQTQILLWKPTASALKRLNKLHKQLKETKDSLLSKEKEKHEKFLEELKSQKLLLPDLLNNKMESIRILIKDKMPLKGLTVKGKIDVSKFKKK